MSRSKIFFLSSMAMLAVVLWFVNSYHKWDAAWGTFPVFLCALIGSALTWWALGHLYWFAHSHYEAGLRMVLLPAVGIVFCLFSGIKLTEPKAQDAWVTDESGAQAYEYNYARTPMGARYYHWRSINVDEPDIESGDSSDIDLGDDGGEAIAYLLLVVLVLVVVVASAFVPHFWVFAGLVLVTVMLRVAWREYQVEHQGGRRGYLY